MSSVHLARWTGAVKVDYQISRNCLVKTQPSNYILHQDGEIETGRGVFLVCRERFGIDKSSFIRRLHQEPHTSPCCGREQVFVIPPASVRKRTTSEEMTSTAIGCVLYCRGMSHTGQGDVRLYAVLTLRMAVRPGSLVAPASK